MAKIYYTLVSREKKPECKWSIEFGDYDRNTVLQERNDIKETNKNQYPDSKMEYQILKTGDTQIVINAAVNELNNKL